MKIYCFGDSIMAHDGHPYTCSPELNGDDVGKLCAGYPSMLKKHLGLEVSANFAVGGDRIAQQKEVILGQDFSDVDLVIIAVGVNDFSCGTPIGSIPDSQETVHDHTFIGDYCTALDHIFRSNPSVKVLLMTPLHRCTLHRVGDVPKNTIDLRVHGQVLDDFAQAILALGRFYACPVADLYGESGLNRFNLHRFTFEGVHPNNAGYEFICPPLIRKVREMLLL